MQCWGNPQLFPSNFKSIGNKKTKHHDSYTKGLNLAFILLVRKVVWWFHYPQHAMSKLGEKKA